MTGQRIAWFAVIAAVVIALVVALGADPGAKATPAERADAIANAVRCPTCAGQSVAESAAPAAQAIKTEIRRRVDAGETREEIESFLEGRYGEDILLTPPRSGIGGLVWIVPVVAIVGAGAGLAVALQRWSRRSLVSATDDDRAIVAAAEAKP